ncbi:MULTISPECIES: hypothetical protein [unclassified Streptomyces]|uniref:hypothetical protein n=1 Tax=unclassified Streptomyces TaxID=2593676 RepID=UPI00324AB3D9
MVASAPLRRSVVAVVLSGALLAGGTACSGDSTKDTASSSSASSSASPTSSAEKQKLAKTRFVANAGLAAGATYQWIVKPYKKGKFKKGADGRTFTLIKAGLAGTFAYNRLKAALNNAKGDPLLARAVAPLSAGVASLKSLPGKLRKGDGGAAGSFDSVLNSVKDAGRSAGAEVKNKVPSTGQLSGG